MIGAPIATPVTTPEADTVAIKVLLLVQVPPAGVEFKVVVRPIHTEAIPVIEVGVPLTVTIAVAWQPVGRV